MAALNLNTIRKTIEKRLDNEFSSGPTIPLIFNNTPFEGSTADKYIQCITTFGASEYITQGTNSSAINLVVGLITLNIFTKQGTGAGDNFVLCKRLRDLFNRMTVSSVRFDPPVGPEILQSSPEGKFQTQIQITFEIYEDL